MKIGIIADVHGRDLWMRAVDNNDADLWVFLGDYVDSFDKSNAEILYNLKEIIRFKEDNMDKVVLLRGNHDIQYEYYPDFGCSGFRPEALPDLSDTFNNNRQLFAIAHQIGNHLFTHAGVTKGWLNGNDMYPGVLDVLKDKFYLRDDLSNLADSLNIVNETSKRWILHEIGSSRGGYKPYGGITWADRTETMNYGKDKFERFLENDIEFKPFDLIPDNIHQYVGHSVVPKIFTVNNTNGSSITYCDCPTGGSFKMIEV